MTKLACLDASYLDISEKLTLKPADAAGAIVEASMRGWVQITGEVLGPSLDVGTLVKMPSGRGHF